MKRNLFSSVALLCCFFVLIVAIADLNGKWTGTIKTPDGNELPLTYNFKVDGNKLTGTGESPAGAVAIDSGKVSGDMFTFQVTVEGNTYAHAGKIYADSCGLDIDFGGQKIHTTLKRVIDK
jgi:hypothetical protein